MTSLKALPPEVAAALREPGATAEHGAPFQDTDVVGPERLPGRRFDIAGVGATHVFAAVERGGMGASVEIWSFERSGEHWTGSSINKYGVFAPYSLRELLFFFCPGYERYEPKGPAVIGSLPPDGSMFVSVADHRHKFQTFKLSSGAISPGSPVYAESRNETMNADNFLQQLSGEERTRLRSRLRFLKAEIRNDDEVTQKVIKQFLSVLTQAR